jgi:predicted DNA-binding transcriptional regulator AlpA
MDQLDRIRTRKQVAEYLGVSTRTLTCMETGGELPPRVQITERIFGYRDSDLSKWVAQRRRFDVVMAWAIDGRCRRIERVLIQVQIDAAGLQSLNGAQQTDERAP